MKNFFVAACCFEFCAVGAVGYMRAQQPEQPTIAVPAPSPMLSITAREVLLDVVVTDALGHPVPGLTAADFSVTEEGAPQQIRRLDEHHAMSAADLARLQQIPTLPPNTFTNFTPVTNTNACTVILLDAMDMSVPIQMYLRGQLISYLKHMQPGASIAIFQVDTEMHLIQGFTSDQQLLLSAAESKRDMPSMNRPMRGTGEVNQIMRMEILRNGMQTLGRYLAGFPGRKNLIWFTAQLPASLFYGGGIGSPFRDSFGVIASDVSGLTDVLTVSRVAVYPVDARGLQGLSQFQAESRGMPTPGSFSASAARQSLNYADLDLVAATTGGKAYYNTNGMQQIIAQVVDDGSNYYSVAYATTNSHWKGEFRRVKITVDRPNVKLQYRQGYFAIDRERQEQMQIAAMARRMQRKGAQASDFEQPSVASPASVATPDGASVPHGKSGFAAAMDLGAIPPTEIVFTASLLAAGATDKVDRNASLPGGNFLRPGWRGKPFRNETILFHTDAHNISLARAPDGKRHGTVEFVAVVYDPTAAVVNTVEKTVVLNLDPSGYRNLLQSGVPVRATIAVPAKGNYFLRLGVRDVDGDHMGALEIPVDQIKPGVAGQGLSQP
jgi:VWFA-related protein